MGLKFIFGIPHTKHGAQLNLTEEEKFMCRVVYKPSENNPKIYKPYALWDPETEYPEDCIAIPIQSTYGGLDDEYPEGTTFVNVLGSSRPTPDPMAHLNGSNSWIALIQEAYKIEAEKPGGKVYSADSCCAETDTIYDSDTGNPVDGFFCCDRMVGGHVLMNKTKAAEGEDNGTVNLLPICQLHNISKACGDHQGDGYYMKLNRAMKPLILNNYQHRELRAYLDNDCPGVGLAADNAEKIVGIDISYCQGGLSFDEVEKAGVKFVIIRAGAGESRDTHLDTFAAECGRRGIPYGFYWYSCAQDVDGAKREAAKCLEVIKRYSPSYPVYFDMEDGSQKKLSKQVCTEMAEAFCEAIKGAGYTAGIYGSPGWFEAFYNYKELFNKYEVWMAHWTEDPDKPSQFNYNQKIWQWGTTKIGGIKVDGNIAFFDYSKK